MRPGERLIDYGNLQSLVVIRFIEQAAALQRDSQQVKIFSGDTGPLDQNRLVALNLASLECHEELALGNHFQVSLTPIQRNGRGVSEGYFFDSGYPNST